MKQDAESHSQQLECGCGRLRGAGRGHRCRRMVLSAFVLGALCAIAGMMAPRATGSVAKAGAKSVPAQGESP